MIIDNFFFLKKDSISRGRKYMVKEILYLSSFTSIKLMANAVDVVAIFESRKRRGISDESENSSGGKKKRI